MTRSEMLNEVCSHCIGSICPIDNEPSTATCKIGKSAIGRVLCQNGCFSVAKESELAMLVKIIRAEDTASVLNPDAPYPVPDEVNHPAHYQGKVECIDEMVAVFGKEAVINFCALNVWKYRYRADKKGGDKDREKADWYMEKIIELKNEA